MADRPALKVVTVDESEGVPTSPQLPSSDSSTVPADSVHAPDPDRLTALAEFAAGAGHEINNPLGTIIGRAQQLLKDETDPRKRQALASIGAQAWRIRDMIGDVMLFARPPQPVCEQVEVQKRLLRVLQTWSRDPAQQQISIDWVVPDSLVVWADPVQFDVVLTELFRNSAQALGGAGVIRVAAQLLDENNRVRLIIADRGDGFSDLERQHAFDPFFSGRQAGRGLGFGLCKVWRIVTLHGGQLHIRCEAGKETQFVMEWPVGPRNPGRLEL